jgi:hypothetical protein
MLVRQVSLLNDLGYPVKEPAYSLKARKKEVPEYTAFYDGLPCKAISKAKKALNEHDRVPSRLTHQFWRTSVEGISRCQFPSNARRSRHAGIQNTRFSSAPHRSRNTNNTVYVYDRVGMVRSEKNDIDNNQGIIN